MSYFQSQSQSLMPAIITNMSLKQSKIASSKSKKQKSIYQVYIIWFLRKAIQKKIIPRNHFLQLYTFGK